MVEIIQDEQSEPLAWNKIFRFVNTLFVISIEPLHCPSLYNVRDERCSDTHANSVVFAPITSTFNAVCFDENPFTCQCGKEDRNSTGIQMLHFYWSFSSDIMAVTGLRACRSVCCVSSAMI